MEPGYKPLWSILMPTLTRREDRFLSLLDGLLPQCEASAAGIEVVGLQNNGERTLAEYRERLLRDARGTYLSFVDDDDAVPAYYVEEIVKALTDPWPPGDDGPDVVSFYQDGTGTAAQITLFGLQYLGAPWQPVWVKGRLTYLRVFSHVQPIRAEIARKGTFLLAGGLGFTQEDQVFAHSVVPELLQRGSKQRHIPKTLYSYLWMSTGESTQQGRQPAGGEAHVRPEVKSPCFRWYEERESDA